MIARLFLAMLFMTALCSALGVVHTQHQARKAFVELQALQDKRDDLNTDWGRLQLEQSTWATHGRIEGTARDRLGMLIPSPADIILVKP